MLNKGLTTGKDPPVHDVATLRSVVINHEFLPGSLLEQLDLAQVEVERVDPLEDDV